MADLPYMPLYVMDLLTDEAVVCMTNEAFGAYMRLLAHEWIEGSLPNDEKKLAKLSNSGRRWGSIRASVMPLFSVIDGNRLGNPRNQEELDKYHRFKKMQAEKARKRWGNQDAAASDRDIQTASLSLSSSSSPSSHKVKSGNGIDWHLVDLIGEVIRKMDGDRSIGDHKDRGFHVNIVKAVPRQIVMDCLARIQDSRLHALWPDKKRPKNYAAYFGWLVKLKADEAGIEISPKKKGADPDGTEGGSMQING